MNYFEKIKNEGVNLKTSLLILGLLCLLIYILFSGGSNKPKEQINIAPRLELKKTILSDTIKRSILQNPNPTKLVKQPLQRTINHTSNVKLNSAQERLFDSLEISTKTYLSKIISPTMMKSFKFDPEGKLKLAIKAYFELSEEVIVNKYKNKIVNSVMLDTIKNDQIDLRFIVYK